MEPRLRQQLASQISRGQVVLCTGAGFSLAAKNHHGVPLPTVRFLSEQLWPIAFPNEPFDAQSTLGDIYEVATKRAGNRAGELLKRVLSVDKESLVDCYRIWFSMPWWRMYTLNIDDLDEVVQRAFELHRRIKPISALSDIYPGEDASLLSIHLNGRLQEYPQVTFSPRQYGERAMHFDPWYSHLIGDILAHPVIFVGTVLDEPLLWQQIELRRSRNPHQRELRPVSYLVTPQISAARRVMLEDFNIKLIEMTQEQFANEVLASMEAEKQQGFLALASRQAAAAGGRFLYDVADLRIQVDDGTGEFLLGREPRWSDITQGRAVKRKFEAELTDTIKQPKSRLTIVTGTAGAGVSTTLMRLAVEFHAAGDAVHWLDTDADLPLWEIRNAVRAAKSNILFLDDVDQFGTSTGTLLADLIGDNKDLRVVAGMRSTRFDKLSVRETLRGNSYNLYAIPHLEDSDIELLLDALTQAKRLGYLRGLTREQQIESFRSQAGRQLLVAMIQATSNERFDEKIDSECQDLPGDLGLIYAIVTIVTSLRSYITKDEVLLGINDGSNESLNRIERLVTQRLLVVYDGNRLRLRHRVVADRAVDYFRRSQQMRDPLQSVLWAIANKAHSEMSRKSREQQLLTRLMNHEFMISVTSDQDTPRLAYAQVEDILAWNYHYYLQRGSYEVQAGDIDLAKNFLDQALSMAPDDYRVETEWAYMTLKRAALNASSVTATEQPKEAFALLEDAIDRRGHVDYYPYHVLGSQGLSWVRRAVISPDEKERILSRIQGIVEEGARTFPRQPELQQLLRDIERTRLMMAVRDKDSTDGS